MDEEFPPIVVDLDLGTLQVGSSHAAMDSVLPRIPRHVETQYDLSLSSLRQLFLLQAYGKTALGYRNDTQARQRHADYLNIVIRETFLRMMVTLFGSVRACIDFASGNPVFDKDKFLQRIPEEAHPFYNQFMATGCFSVFLNSRKHDERDHFDIMCETGRVNLEQGQPVLIDCPDLAQIILAARQANSSEITVSSEPSSASIMKFTETMLHLLSHSIELAKGTNRVAGLLFMRGAYHLQQGDAVLAVQDWDLLSKAAPLSFPSLEITLALAHLPEAQVKSLKERPIVQRSSRWQSLFKTVEKLLNTSPSSIADILQEESFDESQVGSSDSMIESLLQQDTIDEDEFTTLAKFLCICNATYARQLYKALRPDQDQQNGVSVAVFQRFYEEYQRSMATPTIQLPNDVELGMRENIIKHQPMVRIKELGIGTLILTHLHLLFLRSSTTCLQLCRLDSIAKTELDERSFRMKRLKLEIATSPSKRKRKQKTIATKAGLVHIDMGFVMGAETWYFYINELREGNMFAVSTGDKSAVLQAAQNIALAETVATVSTDSEALSPRRSSFKRRGSMNNDYIASSKPTQDLLRFTADRGAKDKSAPVRNHYVKQVDSSPDQRKKTTVECMVYTSGQSPQMWCGMGDGQVKIYRMPAMTYLQSLSLHKKRLTSLCRVDNTIWSCGFDQKIKIVDTKSFRTLEEAEFDDIIAKLEQTRDGYVWGSQLRGVLFKFSKQGLTPIQTIELTGFSTRIAPSAVATIRDRLWVACGSCLAVLDTKAIEGEYCVVHGQGSRSRLPTTTMSPDALGTSFDEPRSASVDILRNTIASAAANGLARGANREIWSFSAATGLIEIRKGLEMELVPCGGIWRLDCNGFNDVVRAQKCMWAAANSGSVFVFDLITHGLLRQLEVHTDRVRALCYVPNGDDDTELVASGSGSGDGTIILWQNQL
eukprot:TRINITY_DN11196_c0_g1_i1.p1 TRINITY_DN11196_c0_g1~~TRINITY_DN11196_c0_g1_i1.p1  ORF type:complete len:1069 (+),score=234.72 TRINITY_DN11196_c0_g1_i1:392-3208(+)